ncbi:MAG: hypothetical protein ABI577_02710 [bacterium]
MSEVARQLEMLDAVSEPAAVRFDTGRDLSGSVAVLPSAYNPPTVAHHHLLERAVQSFHLNGAMALLTTRNVDKDLHGASLQDRVGMLLALAESWSELVIVASNQARIVDQALALTSTFPGVQFDFVVGFDTLERLFAPRYYSDMVNELRPFFARHRVLAANRGAVETLGVQEWVLANAKTFATRIEFLEIEEAPAAMSSTHVRRSIAAGIEHDHLMEPVERYIREHGLYLDEG